MTLMSLEYVGVLKLQEQKVLIKVKFSYWKSRDSSLNESKEIYYVSHDFFFFKKNSLRLIEARSNAVKRNIA